jgi:hypothetical protein
LFFSGMFPVIDYTTGGWIGGMATALDRLLKVLNSSTLRDQQCDVVVLLVRAEPVHVV